MHGGHVKRSRLLGACFSRRSVSHRGHLQRMCSSSSGSSPQNRHKGDSALWQSNCLFCVQTRKLTKIISLLGWYLGTVHRFGCGKLVDACRGFDASHVAASVTCCSPFSKTQSLPDLMEPPAFRSIQQSQVKSPLSREEPWRLPVPTPLAICCVLQPLVHHTSSPPFA